MNPGVEREAGRLEAWVCSECGEQIVDGPDRQPDGTYARGHYHDPPPEHEGEDPYFLAGRIEVVPASVLTATEEELERQRDIREAVRQEAANEISLLRSERADALKRIEELEGAIREHREDNLESNRYVEALPERDRKLYATLDRQEGS